MGGAETFVFNTSDNSIQLSEGHKFYLGSIDNTHSFYITHEDSSVFGSPADGYTSKLVFNSQQNDTTIDFVIQNKNGYSQVKFEFNDKYSYMYPDSSTYNDYEGKLGKVESDTELNPWFHVNAEELKLWKIASGSFATSRSVTFKLDNAHDESYTLTMPKYRPNTADILKVVENDGYGNVRLTWDTDASGSGSVGIINNIQISDGSGGFQSTDWYVTPSNTMYPGGQHNLGSVSNEVYKVYLNKNPDLFADDLYDPNSTPSGIIFSDSTDAFKSSINADHQMFHYQVGGSIDLDGTKTHLHLFDSLIADGYGKSVGLGLGGTQRLFGIRTNRQTFDNQILELPQNLGQPGQALVIDTIDGSYTMITSWQTIDSGSAGIQGSGQAYRIAYFNTTDTITTTVDFDLNFGTNNYLNIPMDLRIEDGEKLFLYSLETDVLNGLAGNTSYLYSPSGSVFVGINGQDKYELNATVFRPLLNKTISLGGLSKGWNDLYIHSNESEFYVLSSQYATQAQVANSRTAIYSNKPIEMVIGSTDPTFNLVSKNGSETLNLRFYDNDNTHYVALKSPSIINTSHTLVLPERDGDPNHVLITDGSGNLSFAPTPMRTIDFIAPIDPSTVFTTTQVRAQIFDDGTTDSSFEIVVRNYDISTVDDQQRKIIVTKEGHIIPSTFEMQDIGTTTDRFRDLFLSGSTIWLGERALSFDEETGRIKSLRVKDAHTNARAYVGQIDETEYSEFEAHSFIIQHEHGKKGERYSVRNSVAYETRVTGSVDMNFVGSPFKIEFGEFGDTTYHVDIADVYYKDPTDFYLRSRGITDIFDQSEDPVGIRLNVDNSNDVRVKGVLNINDNYKFPVDKGSTGQVLAVSEGTSLVWEDKDGVATDPDGNVIYSDRLISGSHEFILRSDGNLYANRDDFQDIGLANVRFRDLFLNQNLHVDKVKYVDEGRLLSKGSVNSNYIEEKLGDSEERKASYILLPQTTDPYMYFQYVDDGIDENGIEVYNDTENKGRLNLSVLDPNTNLYTSDNISSSGFAFDDNIADKIIFSQDDSTLTWDTRPDGTAYDSSNFAFYFGFRIPKHYNIDNVVDKDANEINNVETIITVTSNESDRFGSPPPGEQASIDSYLTIGVVKDIGGFEKDVFKFAIGHKSFLSGGLNNAGYVTFTDKNFGVFENYEIPRDGSVIDVCVYFNDDHPNIEFSENGAQIPKAIAYLYVNSELKDQLEFTHRPSMGAPSKIHIGKSPFGDAPIEAELYYLVNYMSSLDHTPEFISNFQGSIDAVQTQHSEINLDDALIEFKTNKETRLSITNTTIEFFQSYRFPDSSGLDTQVLKTDANGDLYWDFPYDLATLVQEIKDTIDFELGELSNVSDTATQDGEFLVFNGTSWESRTVDIPLTIPELNDVTVSNVQSNEVLAYVNNSVGWVNKSLEDLYGIPEVISDLDDVNAATAASGEFLIYNGAEWVNQTVEIPYNIEELHNVTITTPMTQDVLTWDGSGWINKDVETILTIPKHLRDLEDKSINDLDDVDSTGATHGQLLYYQSIPFTTAEWVPSPTLNNFKGQFMVWQGDENFPSNGRWVMQPAPHTNPISQEPEIPSGSLIKWNGSEWIYDTIEIPRVIEDLENVNTISNQTNDILVWDGTNWHNMDPDTLLGVLAGTVIPENLSDLNIKLLNDLDDVDTAGASDEDVITYDVALGKWVPKRQAPLEYEFHANGNVLTVDTVINLSSDVSLYVTVDNATNTILYGLNDTIDISGITLNGVAGPAGYVMAVSNTGGLEWSNTGMGESNFNVFNSNGLTLTVDTLVNYNYHSNFDISIDKPGYEINIDFANLVQFNSVDLTALTVGGVVGSTGDILTRSSGGGLEWSSISTILGSSGISYFAGHNIQIDSSNVISTKNDVSFNEADVGLLNINKLRISGASGSFGQIPYVATGDVLVWSAINIRSLTFHAGKNIVLDTINGTTISTMETVDFTEVNLSELTLDGVYGTTDQYITINTTGNMVWRDFPAFSSSLQELTDVDIVTANGTVDAKNQQVIKYDYSTSLWLPEYVQDSYYIDSSNHNSSSMILPPTKNYTSYLIDSHALISNYGGTHTEVLLEKSTNWYSGTEISIKNVSRGESNLLKIAWNSSDSSDFIEYQSGSNSQGISLYPNSSVILIVRKGFAGYEAYIKASHGSIDFYQNLNIINIDTVSSNNSSTTKNLINDNYTNLPEEVPVAANILPPSITLNSVDPFFIELGYDTAVNTPDPGVVVIDDVDGAISASSDWNSIVDYNVVGTYDVTYTATDSSGMVSTKTRTVVVQDTTPPALVLNSTQLYINDIYPNGNFMDKIDSTFDYSTPVTVVVDTSEVTINQGTYRVVYIATDAQGNVTTADSTVIVNDYDADQDGILNSRDHFPYDPSEKSDIDGDGIGDSDTIILHQDFKDTLEYLEIDETRLNSSGPTVVGTENVDYSFEDATINGLTKRVLSINAISSGFSKLYTGSINPLNTSINFSMLIPSNYDIPSTERGSLVYMVTNNTRYGYFLINIKKVRNNITNVESFRFSLFLRKWETQSMTFSDTNGLGIDVFERDLSDYDILNFRPEHGQEFPSGHNQGSTYNNDQSAFLRSYVANFDIPNDDQFHAFSFVFGSLTEGSDQNQVGIYMDGNLKCIYQHANTSPFNFGAGKHYLFGVSNLGDLKLSDYIWTRDHDESSIVEIQEKMLNTTFAGPLVSLYSDTDGDQILDLTEQLGGEYDYTLANTDQNTDPNNQDYLDDFIENYIVAYLNGSSNIVSGWNINSGNSTFDDTQTEFKNYYTGELTAGSNITLSKTSTISFWFYNTGSLSGSARLFRNSGAGAWDPIGIDSNGLLYIRESMQTSTVRLGTQNFWDHASSNGSGEWCNIIITTNEETSETKIYFNKVLFDTINYGFTNNTNFNTIMYGTVFHANGWTHFAYWNKELDQSKVNQIYDRGFMAQYDILNAYPPSISSAPDITIDSHFFYHETFSNFDQYIAAVTVSSSESYTVTIDNINSMPFGTVGTSDIIYKVTGDTSGLTGYFSGTLTIQAYSGDPASNYNDLGIIEEYSNGDTLSNGATVTTNGFTLTTANGFPNVIPGGANNYVEINNITNGSDYSNGLTVSVWARPFRFGVPDGGGTQFHWKGTLFSFGNLFLKHAEEQQAQMGKVTGGTFYPALSELRVGPNDTDWRNYTITWSPANGLKVYHAVLPNAPTGVYTEDDFKNMTFELALTRTDSGTFTPPTDFQVAVNPSRADWQRPIDGVQAAKREMSAEEIYSYLRRYLLDSSRTTLLG